MGEWNQSLFDRFFAKVDNKSNTIISHGTITMLVQMVEDGYLKLMTTNNIGAKYALTLSDEELLQGLQALGKQTLLTQFESDPILFRAKLTVPRFFQTDAQDLFEFIWLLFQSRLKTIDGINDIADILGKQIDRNRVAQAFQLVQNPPQGVDLTKLNKELNNDERTVLGYYLTIQNYIAKNEVKWVQDIMGQLLQRSLGGGSQLITFERIQ